MKHVRARNWVALLAILLLAPTLAACDSTESDNEPIAARLNDGALEVAVCSDVALTKVFVETRAAGFVNQAVTVWEAEGRLGLTSGDVLSSASTPEGLTASTWDQPQMAPGGELFITLTGENEETLDVTLVVPLEGFPRSEWLHADRSLTDTACD